MKDLSRAIRALPAVATAFLALAAAPMSAHAVGQLADVSIVDRDTGATLPIHRAQGEYWVAGRPGARYAITVRNRLGERVLAVPSVDGVNVLSGETAAWDQRGYVFSPYERYQITGWRKSSTEVAAFEFSIVGEAYATRTGRPAHVGVIGVALFREQPRYAPRPSAAPEPHGMRREDRNDANDAGGSHGPSKRLERLRDAPASPAARAPAPEAESSAAQAADSRAKAAPLPAPQLGTAHGQRETSVVTHTSFSRLQSHPNEVISIRYDSLANLIARGVIREPIAGPHVPRAFPRSDNVSYVPDPPN
ncbi:hypothetical protein [Paracidovorax sp. MALMAid1276]|uniref:hypothetical protein n=1 Tax=Paracidovorax sp. MALMAid1276 TaxID=3411631 RepID=UPI003B9C29B2